MCPAPSETRLSPHLDQSLQLFCFLFTNSLANCCCLRQRSLERLWLFGYAGVWRRAGGVQPPVPAAAQRKSCTLCSDISPCACARAVGMPPSVGEL